MIWLAHRVFVPDDKSGFYFVAEANQTVVGKAAEYESNVFLCAGRGDIGNAFIEELKMPEIGVRVKRYWCEINDNRFAQCICGLDSSIECDVIDGALRSLHPVNDTTAVGIRMASAAHRRAWIL